jgi:hypothetical protein
MRGRVERKRMWGAVAIMEVAIQVFCIGVTSEMYWRATFVDCNQRAGFAAK